jgi:hypothetical protein
MLHRRSESGEEEARMKAIHSLSARILTSALSGALLVTMEGGAAVAKSRHHFPGDVVHGSKSSGPLQKSAGASDAAASNSANTVHMNGNTNASADDKGRHDSSALPDNGPMKKGDNLPSKVTPHGTVDSGKNQVGDRGDAVRYDVVHPSATTNTEAGKTEAVIADGPGHKTKKATDTTKKVTTIFRPLLLTDHGHPSVGGNIERNAVGVVIHNVGAPNPGLDSKLDSKLVLAPASAHGLTASNTIANAAKPTIGHARNNAVENPPKYGPTIDGTSFGRPGSNLASIGGSTKNIAGTLSGNSFKPKYP